MASRFDLFGRRSKCRWSFFGGGWDWRGIGGWIGGSRFGESIGRGVRSRWFFFGFGYYLEELVVVQLVVVSCGFGCNVAVAAVDIVGDVDVAMQRKKTERRVESVDLDEL